MRLMPPSSPHPQRDRERKGEMNIEIVVNIPMALLFLWLAVMIVHALCRATIDVAKERADKEASERWSRTIVRVEVGPSTFLMPPDLLEKIPEKEPLSDGALAFRYGMDMRRNLDREIHHIINPTGYEP